MKNLTNILALVILLLTGCSPQQKPIDYGIDKCAFCRMTIVSPQHAAELVTTKGKVSKFDAIECMIRYRNEKGHGAFALQLVNDYLSGGKLKDAGTCTYLISKNLPSPMGEFLSAFETREDAIQLQKENGGELFTWEEITSKYN